MNILKVSNLTKTYRVAVRNSGLKNAFKSFIKKEYNEVKAVEDISFELKKGEIVGLIGPNGAGKSTTIKMLTGILKPDSGNIKVLGMNPSEDRVKYVKNIGVVFGQKSQLWWDIPAEDSFDLLKEIYKIPDKLYENNKNELVSILHLEEIIKKPVRQLSLGERMKCELVASLLHNPKILFLDEPTLGLDVIARKELWKVIYELKGKITIILTTHYMEEAESLSDRIGIMANGNIVEVGTSKELINKTKAKNFEDAFVSIATGGEL